MTDTHVQGSGVAVRPKQSRLRRGGCAVLLVLWFLILLLPCFCLALATQGEIVIPQGGAPGQVIRVWTIMEADQRGLGVSSTSAQEQNANALCVETITHYLLWMGSEVPSTSCECYERASANAPWSTTSVSNQACGAAVE